MFVDVGGNEDSKKKGRKYVRNSPIMPYFVVGLMPSAMKHKTSQGGRDE